MLPVESRDVKRYLLFRWMLSVNCHSLDVKFDGPTQEIPGLVKLATFYDPDGNNYMLNESLSDELPD